MPSLPNARTLTLFQHAASLGRMPTLCLKEHLACCGHKQTTYCRSAARLTQSSNREAALGWAAARELIKTGSEKSLMITNTTWNLTFSSHADFRWVTSSCSWSRRAIRSLDNLLICPVRLSAQGQHEVTFGRLLFSMWASCGLHIFPSSAILSNTVS